MAGTTQIKAQWHVCFILALLYMVANIDRFIINLMVEPMKRDLVLSDTQVSLLVGITFSLFYVLFGLPIARLADRANRRNILAAGIGVWSLMTALGGVAQNFWHLFIARMGVGVGEATIAPTAHSILADSLPPEKLSRGFGIFNMGAVLGGALAFIVGGALLAWAGKAYPNGLEIPLVGSIFSWQLVFVIVGLPGVLLAFLFMLTVKEPPRHNAVSETPMPLGEVVDFMKQHKRVFIAIYGGLALVQISAGGLAAWMPALMERKYGLAPDAAAPYLVMSLIVPGLLSSFASGWAADKMLARGTKDAHLKLIVWSLALSAIPFSIAPLMPTPELQAAIFGVSYFFVFMQMILCPSALQLIAPSRMRAVLGSLVMVCTVLIGHGSGPTVVALITDFGFADESKLDYSLFIVCAVCVTLSTLVFATGRKAFGEMMENTQNALRVG